MVLFCGVGVYVCVYVCESVGVLVWRDGGRGRHDAKNMLEKEKNRRLKFTPQKQWKRIKNRKKKLSETVKCYKDKKTLVIILSSSN